MAPASLSVVIPVLNELALVPVLAARVAQLQAEGAEVVVVDGGSHDGTAEALLAAGVQVLDCAPGRGQQLNRGAAATGGQMLLFLHADTVFPSAALQWIRPPWGRFDVRLDATGFGYRWVEAGINLRSRLSGIATGDQAMFVERGLFEAVGGFPAQPLLEDVELSTRLRARHRPICVRAKVRTSARRWQQYGLLQTVILMWRLRYDYWRGAAPSDLYRRYYQR